MCYWYILLLLHVLLLFIYLFLDAIHINGYIGVENIFLKYSSGSLTEGRKEMFYLTTHSTHFIIRLYGVGHMAKDHLDSERGNPLPPHGLLFPITARVNLYAPSHRQDSTYHSLCYTSRGALAGTRNSSIGPPHEGSIR